MSKMTKLPTPPVNPLRDLFNRYILFRKVSTDEIGVILNCSGQNIRASMARPVEKWRMGEIQQFCEILNCPLTDALEAVADYYKKRK